MLYSLQSQCVFVRQHRFMRLKLIIWKMQILFLKTQLQNLKPQASRLFQAIRFCLMAKSLLRMKIMLNCLKIILLSAQHLCLLLLFPVRNIRAKRRLILLFIKNKPPLLLKHQKHQALKHATAKNQKQSLLLNGPRSSATSTKLCIQKTAPLSPE